MSLGSRLGIGLGVNGAAPAQRGRRVRAAGTSNARLLLLEGRCLGLFVGGRGSLVGHDGRSRRALIGSGGSACTCSCADGLEPSLGFGRAVRLECQLRCSGQLAADTLTLVLALDVELLSAGSSNHGIGEVDGQLGLGVVGKVVVVLELVQELGRGNNIVARLGSPRELVARLALQRTLDQSLCGVVVLVGEVDGIDASWRVVRVDEVGALAVEEAHPLEIGRDSLSGAQHVGVEGTRLLGLAASHGIEGLHGLLDDLDHMGLERLEVFLQMDQVVAVVVLLDDLLVQSVVDAALDAVGVLGRVHLAAGRLKGCAVLAQQFNVFLSSVPDLLDLLCALAGAVLDLLDLGLDLLVQSLEDGEDGSLEGLLGLGVGVDHGLCVDSHVLEEAGNTTQALVEMPALLKRLRDRLENLLILFGVVRVGLLDGGDIVLEVSYGVLPGLESFGEEASGL